MSLLWRFEVIVKTTDKKYINCEDTINYNFQFTYRFILGTYYNCYTFKNPLIVLIMLPSYGC